MSKKCIYFNLKKYFIGKKYQASPEPLGKNGADRLLHAVTTNLQLLTKGSICEARSNEVCLYHSPIPCRSPRLGSLTGSHLFALRSRTYGATERPPPGQTVVVPRELPLK